MLTASLYWTDTSKPNLIRLITVSDIGTQLIASNNGASTFGQVQATPGYSALRYVDSSNPMKNSQVQLRDNGTLINGETVSLAANNSVNANASIEINDSSVVAHVSDDITVRSSAVGVIPAMVKLTYSDIVTPANSSEIVVTSSELKLSAALIKLVGVPTYADDAAAGAGGLVTGHLFQTGGQLFIKQ